MTAETIRWGALVNIIIVTALAIHLQMRPNQFEACFAIMIKAGGQPAIG